MASGSTTFNIDHTKIDAALTNFPIAIDLAVHGGSIFTDLGANKLKLKVRVGTTECYTEIEHWDSANGKGVLHSKIASVSDTADTAIELSWDSTWADNTTYVGATNSTAAESVWDSNFVAVYHMAQDPSGTAPQILDSTSNDNDGTSAGTMTSADLVDGDLGKAINFDGSDDCIKATSVLSSSYTIEMLLKLNNASDDKVIGSFSWDYVSGTGRLLKYVSATTLKIYTGNVNNEFSCSLLDSQRYLLTLTSVDSGACEFFKDAVAVTSFSQAVTDNTGLLALGAEKGSYSFLKSEWGEFRVSNVVRSNAWIKATNASLKKTLLYTPLYITGIVKLDTTAVARTVACYKRSDLSLVDSTTSDASDGSYSLMVGNSTDEHFVVCLDDDAGDDYKALIRNRVTGS